MVVPPVGVAVVVPFAGARRPAPLLLVVCGELVVVVVGDELLPLVEGLLVVLVEPAPLEPLELDCPEPVPLGDCWELPQWRGAGCSPWL